MNNIFCRRRRLILPMLLLHLFNSFQLFFLLFIFALLPNFAIFVHNHQPITPISSQFVASSKWPKSSMFLSEIRFMQKLYNNKQQQHDGGGGGDGGDDGKIGNSAVIGYVPTIAVKKCHADDGRSSGVVPGWALKFALNKLAPTERYIRAELHVHGKLNPFLDVQKATLHIVKFMCSSSSSSKNSQEKLAKKIGKNFHYEKSLPSSKNWTDSSTTIWPSRHIQLGLARVDQSQRHIDTTAGWTMFDAMTPLLYTMMDDHDDDDDGEQHQDELHINLFRYHKPLDERQLKRFLHKHRPFLVIYTENNALAPKARKNDAIDKEMLVPRRTKRDIRATLTDYDDLQQNMDKVRKTAEYFSYGMAKVNVKDDDDANEQMPLQKNANANTFDTFRRLNRRRKMKNRKSKSHQHQKQYPGFDPNDPMLGFGTPFSPWQRISPPLRGTTNAGTSLNNILGLRSTHGYWMDNEMDGNGTKSGGTIDMANDETKIFIMEENSQKIAKCALHNMTVDFHELGWSDRIIAPKRFEAGFCGGHCDYPLENDSNPSNHAILQSLIATQRHQQFGAVPATQRQPTLPAVCCAPTKFDSLTLLYFDERDNVVLKNYPRMVVLSCGCT